MFARHQAGFRSFLTFAQLIIHKPYAIFRRGRLVFAINAIRNGTVRMQSLQSGCNVSLSKGSRKYLFLLETVQVACD